MSRHLRHLLLILAFVAVMPHWLLAQQAQQREPRSVPARLANQAAPAPAKTYEAVPVPAQPGGAAAIAGPPWAALTLDQASDLAIRNNPLLAKARAQIDSKLGVAIQAGIPQNPRWDTNNPQVFGGNQSQYNAGFQVTVPTMGKLRLDRAQAMQDVGQARYAYVRQSFELLTAVRQQFYRVLAQERRVEVLEQLVAIATNSHGAALQRKQAGTVAETDVLLLEVELQQAQIALENARIILFGARRALAATIGTPNLPINDALGDLKASLPEFDEDFLRQFVATQNAAILEARLQVVQNRILLRRAEVEPVPDIYTGPAIAWGPSSSSAGKSGEQFWYNFQFNIPVWNLNQGGVRAANANIRDAVASVGTLQNDLLRQTADMLALFRSARDRARYIGDKILPTAERTQVLTRSAYDVGQVDVSPVLQAQRALTQVNLDYIDTLENAWTSAATLAGLLQIERFP